MNKLGLFLCFFLAISYAQSEVVDGIDVDDVYDKFVIIARGLADSNEYKCSNQLSNNRNTILPRVVELIKNLKDKDAIRGALTGFAFQLILIDGIFDDCNIWDTISKLLSIMTASGISNMGQNMKDNASELEGLIKELTEANNQDTRLLVIGKIIRKITGITFK